MKTSIKNLITLSLTLITLTSSAFATEGVKTTNVTVLNQAKKINKIEVKGNVEIILVQSPAESVKVYDSYYSKNALVQQQDGVLRISSFEKEALVVAVYVNELSSIEAAGTSTVKTSGKISFLSLAVTLKDQASADIKATTVNLYTSVQDNAKLKLSGSTTDHFALLGSQAKMSMDQFVATCTSVNTVAPIFAKVAPTAAQSLEAVTIVETF